MEKIEIKFGLMNQLQQVTKIEEEDLAFHREQSFIDRVQISALKT